MLDGALDLPALRFGERLAVFQVVGVLGFDDEVVLVLVAAAEIAAFEDEAEIRIVVADGGGMR